MANTYTLISSNVLASSAASVTFSAIPSTYTDLVLRLNARTNYASTRDNIWLTVNSSATGYSETVLYGFTGTAASLRLSTQTKWSKIYTNASTSTASTFSSVELYFPDYSGFNYKVMSGENVVEGNITTSGTILAATADLWQSTSAITSMTMVPETGTSFDSGSSFYLYGIKNS
jgi:hypothetical protein